MPSPHIETIQNGNTSNFSKLVIRGDHCIYSNTSFKHNQKKKNIYKAFNGEIPIDLLLLLHLGFSRTHYNCELHAHNQEGMPDLLLLLVPQTPTTLKCCSVNLAYIGKHIECLNKKSFTYYHMNT